MYKRHYLYGSYTLRWRFLVNIWVAIRKTKNDKSMKSFFLKERKLQGVIEEAYLDYLKQGKERGKFRFATAEHEYTLFFCPTGMYQVNSKTNTKRRVRRRPGKVISNEDVENLKWYDQHSVSCLTFTFFVSFPTFTEQMQAQTPCVQ